MAQEIQVGEGRHEDAGVFWSCSPTRHGFQDREGSIEDEDAYSSYSGMSDSTGPARPIYEPAARSESASGGRPESSSSVDYSPKPKIHPFLLILLQHVLRLVLQEPSAFEPRPTFKDLVEFLREESSPSDREMVRIFSGQLPYYIEATLQEVLRRDITEMLDNPLCSASRPPGAESSSQSSPLATPSTGRVQRSLEKIPSANNVQPHPQYDSNDLFKNHWDTHDDPVEMTRIERETIESWRRSVVPVQLPLSEDGPFDDADDADVAVSQCVDNEDQSPQVGQTPVSLEGPQITLPDSISSFLWDYRFHFLALFLILGSTGYLLLKSAREIAQSVCMLQQQPARWPPLPNIYQKFQPFGRT